MRRSLTREERIRKREDFLRLFAAPIRYQCRGMKLYFSPGERARLGIVLSRKFGTAVQRNKNKRWIRELFRCSKEGIPSGDYLFSLQAGEYTFEDRKRQFHELLSGIVSGRVP